MARRQPPDQEPAGPQAQPSAAPCGTAGLPAGLPKRRLLVARRYRRKFPCPHPRGVSPAHHPASHTPRPCVDSAQAPGVARVPPDEARSPPLLSREGAGGAPHTGLWGSPAPAFLLTPSSAGVPVWVLAGLVKAGPGPPWLAPGPWPLAPSSGRHSPPPSGGAAAPSPVPSGHSAFSGDLPVPCD